MPLALIVTTVCLFAATTLLYIWQNQQRAVMSATVQGSGWVAYQAQLEYVKSRVEMERAVARPTGTALEALQLRLELLRSRLPLLYQAEEGKLLNEIASLKSGVQEFEVMLDTMLDRLPTLAPSEIATSEEIGTWLDTVEPLGRTLQSVLMAAVAYNGDLYRRERELAAMPAIVPLALLFISGASLAGVLLLQAWRDRQRLAAVEAATAALTAMEENLRAVIEAVPASMTVIDPRNDTVSFINPAAATMVDASPDHPDWQRLIRAALEAARLGDGPRGTLKMTFAKANGDVVSLCGTLCSVIFEGRAQTLLVLMDETRVRDADLQLLQAAKLATLGELSTAIAHELNQPLAVIRMAVANAHRMLAADGDRTAIAGKLDRVSSQVERAKSIIDQIRRYGRIPSDSLDRFSLRHAIELAVGFVAQQYRASGIRLTIQLDIPPELMVVGEQALFEQVIVNLLVNARDAFQEKALDHVPSVWLRARSNGAEAVIEVEDDAGGIGEEMLLKLFEPFSTTKSVEKGTGLGLSLARSVVRQMNGQITAGNMWAGACFTVVLPVSAAVPAREAA
ncbi:ATP-binding protein [Aquabacter sp. CN5-332]|uniref:sensor histidine kinase n=1 Tax=Aquabacter sp. CN5-332 TaxID=3156608 RepID=UPI0032B556AE